MTLSIADPPTPSSGTMLIFDIASFSSARLYVPGSDVAHAAFTIRSKQDGKRRCLHLGAAPDGAITGELILHGVFKKGLGMVSLARGTSTAGSTLIPIEDWAQIEKNYDGLTVSAHGHSYTWSLRPVDLKNGRPYPTQVIYDARRDGGVVVATWYASHTHQQRLAEEIATTSTTSTTSKSSSTLVRSHILFADEIANDNTVPDLLLSLMLLNGLRLRKPGPRHDGVAGVMIGLLSSVL